MAGGIGTDESAPTQASQHVSTPASHKRLNGGPTHSSEQYHTTIHYSQSNLNRKDKPVTSLTLSK